MKYFKEYKLKKDLPDFPKGTKLKWDFWNEEYTEYGHQPGMNNRKPMLRFSKESLEAKPEWFEPVGEEYDYYAPFPSQKDFFDYNNGHWSDGIRHNNMCNVCKTMKKLNFQKEIDDFTYNIIKEKYQKFTKQND